MSLSMSDMVRFQALEMRVAELEKHMTELCCGAEKRRGRPPKNLEERMKAQEHDDPYAGAQNRVNAVAPWPQC